MAEHDPNIIEKYDGRVGRALWSVKDNDFVRDEHGRPIPAEGEVTRCPTCGAIKVRR